MKPEAEPVRRPRRLVLGVGNSLRGDDGAGSAVVAELRRLAPDGVELAAVRGEASELLEAWSGADFVTIVDASCSGSPAGTLSRFDAVRETLPCSSAAGSTHGFGLNEAIELGRVLDRLPRRLEVYAIEGRDFREGAGLSREVRRSVHRLASRLAGSPAPGEPN